MIKLRSEFDNIIRNNELIKYFTIGAVTQLLDFASFSLLITYGVNYIVADFINNPLVFAFNFLGHKYFTFQKKSWSSKQVWKYIANLIINYLYVTGLLILFTSVFEINSIISKFLTIIAVPLINFLFLKRFVFQK